MYQITTQSVNFKKFNIFYDLFYDLCFSKIINQKNFIKNKCISRGLKKAVIKRPLRFKYYEHKAMATKVKYLKFSKL